MVQRRRRRQVKRRRRRRPQTGSGLIGGFGKYLQQNAKTLWKDRAEMGKEWKRMQSERNELYKKTGSRGGISSWFK